MSSAFSDIEQRLLRVKAQIPSAVKSSARIYALTIAAIMSAQFMRKGEGNREQNVVAPSSSNKIGLGSGALYRSYLPGDKNNEYGAELSGTEATFFTKSKLIYANIHEHGGFIKAKKTVGSVKRKKEVFAMEQMFWRKHMETKNPYWRSMALAVRKRGGVNIPARPYLSKSVEEFNAKHVDRFASALSDNILKAYENG